MKNCALKKMKWLDFLWTFLFFGIMFFSRKQNSFLQRLSVRLSRNLSMKLFLIPLFFTLLSLCKGYGWGCSQSPGFFLLLIFLRKFLRKSKGRAYKTIKHYKGSHSSLLGNTLKVQHLGLRTFTTEVLGSVLSQGTKIPQATQHSQNIN